MPIEKAFDPTLPRVSSNVPNDIDVVDSVLPSSSASSFFQESLNADGPMPPPLPGETELSPPLDVDANAEMMENVREKLAVADSRVRDFIERRPVVALCGAVAAGFFIGRLVSRL